MSGTQTIEQSYKNRSQAFAKFIKGTYPISKSQFYDDCEEYGLVKLDDKTVPLSGLLAYVRKKCDINPTDNRPLADQEHDQEMRELDLREKRADVAAKEAKARKESDLWMEVVEHEIQMASFAGHIESVFEQQKSINLSRLIYLAGGDIANAAEVDEGLNEMFRTVLTEAVKMSTVSVAFEDNEEETESMPVEDGAQ